MCRLVNQNCNDIVYVTPPPNSINIWGYSNISGQNIQFPPILLLLTSHFMFGHIRPQKKIGVGNMCGGARRVVVGCVLYNYHFYSRAHLWQ